MTSPSLEIMNAAQDTVTVQDARGRNLSIRQLNALDRFRIFGLLGPENAKNEQCLGYATLAYAVTRIDDDPQPRAASMLVLEALIQTLDDDGLVAVAQAIGKHFLPGAEAVKDEVKKESSTPG
jgi:hypothetical protein